MNKKIIALIASTLMLSTQPAMATKNTSIKNNTDKIPALAIMDTGFNTSLPIFSGRITQEVCIIGWSTCPNGSGFQEGPGSSVVDPKFIMNNGFEHGTQMASIALQRNSKINVVLIRIIGNTADGRRQIVPDSTISSALDWVLKNKDLYNIKAVSMSQGSLSRNTNSLDYCVKVSPVTSAVDSLSLNGVPTFFSAGNERNYTKINWPACIPSAIAISAVDKRGEVPLYTNYDSKLTDFVAQGNIDAILPTGQTVPVAGTSASTQVAAADWLALQSAKPLLSNLEIYNLILRTSKVAPGAKVKDAKLFDLAGAINGK